MRQLHPKNLCFLNKIKVIAVEFINSKIPSPIDFRSLSFVKQKEYNVGDENGIYAITLNRDGSKAAIGLGSGSIMVRYLL